MADLRTRFAGIAAPNPFWLASAPPTDKAYNIERAFRAGWGGAVWKTLGEDPPIVNVTSRYGAVAYNGQRMMGFNNIELITDRPLDVNLQEIKQVKRDWHVRTRHGLGRRPGARIRRDGDALVQAPLPHAGDREANA
jgi:dihydropyrimidine dehydrogenase (NAD+) subunit PreA